MTLLHEWAWEALHELQCIMHMKQFNVVNAHFYVDKSLVEHRYITHAIDVFVFNYPHCWVNAVVRGSP